MKRLLVSEDMLHEAANIADGAYAPVKGFLRIDELSSVLESQRMPQGDIWSMPIVLPVSNEDAQQLAGETHVVLVDEHGTELYELRQALVYEYDLNTFARLLFGTVDEGHPGVAQVLSYPGTFLGGEVRRVADDAGIRHGMYRTPSNMKALFKDRGWNTVVAFQTRNAPHRSHEYLQKRAMEQVDGLLIQPLVGPKKSGDFRDEHILGAYDRLLDTYYSKDRVLFGIFHTYMRYAGPKEALFHALVRRNFGCTHMIVGRDHAGAGSYYGSYDAQRIFDQFSFDELGIEIIKCNHAFFCHGCGDMVFEDACPHSDDDRVIVSGTRMREMLMSGTCPPQECMRPEVAEYLLNNKGELFV